MPDHHALRDLVVRHFRWAAWDALIEKNGLAVERPARSEHPDHPEIVYPMDYGFVRGTRASDGHAVDCFIGSAETGGLVGLLLTKDHRKGDREAKLLWGCTPREVYLANGFINFDRRLMSGVLVLRQPMCVLWGMHSGA